MLADGSLVVAGLLLLLAGGEAIVRGASGIGLLARLSPAVVGLTIVGAGTSMPELVVSVQGSLRGENGIALGNIVGSNIYNVGLVLGLTAIVRPLLIQGNSVRFEWPVLALVTGQVLLLGRDGELDRLEGAFLLGGLVVFLWYVVLVARRSTNPVERAEFATVVTTLSLGRSGGGAWALNGLGVAAGVALLAVGSGILVDGAVGLATTLGVSKAVIGLTIVAFGTSSPELVTSIVAAYRGRSDMAVTNVLGSNVFNLLGIGGLTALVAPVAVPEAMIARDNWWMLGMALVLFPVMKTGMRVTRKEGAVLVGAACLYTTWLLVGA